jgi:acylphosphatase
MSSEPQRRLHAVVKGRVQGVGFRVFVQQYAAGLKLTGWVRNTFAGDVEILAEGSEPALENLIFLLEAGPRGSHVIQVDRNWSDAAGEFSEFSIERTA